MLAAPTPDVLQLTPRRLRFEPPPPEEGGRERRVFTLEPPGLEILKESKETLDRLWEGLPALNES